MCFTFLKINYSKLYFIDKNEDINNVNSMLEKELNGQMEILIR